MDLEKLYIELEKFVHLSLIDKNEIAEKLIQRWASKNEGTATKDKLTNIFLSCSSTVLQRIPGDNFSYFYLPVPSLPGFCQNPWLLPEPLKSPPYQDLRVKNKGEKEFLVHADLDRPSAVQILMSHEDGTFLLRNSSDNKNLAISLKKGGVIQHYRIEKTGDEDEVKLKGETFQSLMGFVKHYQEKWAWCLLKPNIVNGVFGIPFVSRFCDEFRSLALSSRMEITSCLGILEDYSPVIGTMSQDEEGEWILKTWIEKKEENFSANVFMTSLCKCGIGKTLWEDIS